MNENLSQTDRFILTTIVFAHDFVGEYSVTEVNQGDECHAIYNPETETFETIWLYADDTISVDVPLHVSKDLFNLAIKIWKRN